MSFEVNYFLFPPELFAVSFLTLFFKIFFLPLPLPLPLLSKLFCVHEHYFHRYSVTLLFHDFYLFVSLV